MPSPSSTASGRLGRTDGLLLAAAAIWGINFSVVKAALAFLPPLAFNAVRFAVAAVALVTLVRAAGYSMRFARRDLPFLIGLGLVGNSVYQALFVYGAALTSADHASLMLSTVPAWVALFGTLAGTDRLAGRGWLGVALALAGVAVIVRAGSGHGDAFRFGGASLAGDLLVLVATVCWSLYTLLLRRALVRYPAPSVAAFTTAIGAGPLILAGLPGLIGAARAGVAPWVYFAAAGSGFFAIAVAYVLWNVGVSRLGSARTALYNNLVLPIAVVTAWLTLGETLTATHLFGIALAIGGVTLARRHVRPS